MDGEVMGDRPINGKQHSLAIPATEVDQGLLEMLISWVVTQLGYTQQWCMLPKNSTSPKEPQYMPCFTRLDMGGLISVTYCWCPISGEQTFVHISLGNVTVQPFCPLTLMLGSPKKSLWLQNWTYGDLVTDREWQLLICWGQGNSHRPHKSESIFYSFTEG